MTSSKTLSDVKSENEIRKRLHKREPENFFTSSDESELNSRFVYVYQQQNEAPKHLMSALGSDVRAAS